MVLASWHYGKPIQRRQRDCMRQVQTQRAALAMKCFTLQEQVTCRRENGEYSKLPIFSQCPDPISSYWSMDYIYLSSLVGIILLSIIISYNITCQ